MLLSLDFACAKAARDGRTPKTCKAVASAVLSGDWMAISALSPMRWGQRTLQQRTQWSQFAKDFGVGV